LATIALHTIIKDSLKRSISYADYRELVSKLVSENTTSGHEKTEALIDYTKLNDRRMKRWDKTLKITEDQEAKISSITTAMTWLVITESWCGDAAHVIPVLNKMASASEVIDLKLVFRDENEALMDQFLTNGGRAIAKVIIIDTHSGEVLHTYGPRPHEASKLVQAYKAAHGALTPEFKEALQVWYNKDKGQAVINDLLKLLDT